MPCSVWKILGQARHTLILLYDVLQYSLHYLHTGWGNIGVIFFPPFFSLGGGCGPMSGCYIITVVAPWAELENTNNFVFSSLIVLSEQFRTIWFQGHWVFHQYPYHAGDSNWLGRSALVYYLLFLCRVNTGVDHHVEGGRSSFVIYHLLRCYRPCSSR